VRYTNACNELHVQRLIQFRCGGHDLGVETGRWQRPPLLHKHRMCTKCSWQAVDDEYHMIVECPELHDVRMQHAPLFAVFGGVADMYAMRSDVQFHQEMRVFMNQKPTAVGAFIHECLEARTHLPDVTPYTVDPFTGLPTVTELFDSD
jgi:hypothetical protein